MTTRFTVRVPFVVWVSVDVEADDENEAEEIGLGEASISGYCGNGGSNKLVGVSGENLSIEHCDEPLDLERIHVQVEASE